jgi:hypothetical protein
MQRNGSIRCFHAYSASPSADADDVILPAQKNIGDATKERVQSNSLEFLQANDINALDSNILYLIGKKVV